jgi:1,4-alpha-glucan branching enzyme
MTIPIPADLRYDASLLSSDDLHWFNEGTHARLFERLGAHLGVVDGAPGTHFAVWAPNAERVSVIGDFNAWDPDRHRLRLRGASGIWEGFLPGVRAGTVYKYRVVSKHNGYEVSKADPFAFAAETPPRTASVVASLDYTWRDADWMADRWRMR